MIFKVGGVIVYLGILLWLGVLASRRMKDIKDYFAAGKNLGFLAVASRPEPRVNPLGC